jgi:hypothetical protein
MHTPIKHPLSAGTQILSVFGEEDLDENGQERFTRPMAVGTISRRECYGGVRWSYDVQFPNGTSVWLDEHEVNHRHLYFVIPER